MKEKIKKYIVIHEWYDANGVYQSREMSTIFNTEKAAQNYIKRQTYPNEYFVQGIFK